MGNCQIGSSALSGAVGLASCEEASFTGTCSGSTLTASSVTGEIQIGLTLGGTGIPAGTTVAAFGTGRGGTGTYTTSQACTASSNSLTASGIPSDAQGHRPTLVVLSVEVAAVRYKDDGSAPTSSIGVELPFGTAPFTYSGTLSAIQFIAATGSPVIDAAFYRSP